MPNRTLPQSVRTLTHKGSALTNHTESLLPTGISSLDALLSGGIPRGKITEMTGAGCSGKTSVVLSLLAQATERGELVAYIDPRFSLDPVFAQRAGVDLERLLWIGGRTSFSQNTALKAADILTRASGLGVIVLDLEARNRKTNRANSRKFPFHVWFRLQRVLKGTSTILILLAREPVAGSASSLVMAFRRLRTQWQFIPENNSCSNDLPHACLLQGISSRIELLQNKSLHHATLYCRL